MKKSIFHPAYCHALHPGTGELVVVGWGRSGYTIMQGAGGHLYGWSALQRPFLNADLERLGTYYIDTELTAGDLSGAADYSGVVMLTDSTWRTQAFGNAAYGFRRVPGPVGGYASSGAVSGGNTTITSLSAVFLSNMVGRTITLDTAYGYPPATVSGRFPITAVLSPTQVQIAGSHAFSALESFVVAGALWPAVPSSYTDAAFVFGEVAVWDIAERQPDGMAPWIAADVEAACEPLKWTWCKTDAYGGVYPAWISTNTVTGPGTAGPNRKTIQVTCTYYGGYGTPSLATGLAHAVSMAESYWATPPSTAGYHDFGDGWHAYWPLIWPNPYYSGGDPWAYATKSANSYTGTGMEVTVVLERSFGFMYLWLWRFATPTATCDIDFYRGPLIAEPTGATFDANGDPGNFGSVCRIATVAGAGAAPYVFTPQVGSLSIPNWPADPTAGSTTSQGYMEGNISAPGDAAVMKWQFQYHF